MNLTEAEAKQRWCPFANVGFGTRLPGVINRLQITDQDKSGQTVASGETIIPAGAKCLGSACMAWRWMKAEANTHPWLVTMPDKEPERYAWNPTGHEGYAGATVEPAPAPQPSAGRCGLAG
jgi:hypothetical protein